MTPPRRGLTLIEVLAAVALLSLIAATCTPLMQRSLGLLGRTAHTIDVGDLGRLADLILAEPERFELPPLEELIEATVTWIDGEDMRLVTVRRIPTSAEGVDHGWIAVTCADRTVLRWIAVEVEIGQEAEGVHR